MPVERLEEFLDWFDARGRDAPGLAVPAGLRGTSTVAHLPARSPGTTYVNVGFWGTVHVGPDAPDAPRNRAIEAKVHELGGHKSLYSEAFYDRETFDRLYDGRNLAAVKQRYDPDDRFTQPLRQGGDATMTHTSRSPSSRSPRRSTRCSRSRCRCGSRRTTAARPAREDSPYGMHLANERGLRLPPHRAGRPRLRPRVRRRRPEVLGAHPGDPYDAFKLIANKLSFRRPTRPRR